MQYKRCLVTFLDILGFREIIGRENPGQIATILRELSSAAHPGEDIAEQFDISFVTFSDNTVRAANIESETNRKYQDGILWHELYSLVHAQARLIGAGCLLRGGMTIGQIAVEDGLVFGPGLVRAYGLESEFAIYPRIVIDPVVFDTLENDPLLRSKRHGLEGDREYIQQLVRCGSDGLYFVDYFRGILSEFSDEGEDVVFIEDHKALILKRCRSQERYDKITAKLLWLARYHNDIVRGLGEEWFAAREVEFDDHLISHNELPLIYDL
ncbi:MAG: hypothetical protein AB7O68_16905 [Pirellulales bacterium]